MKLSSNMIYRLFRPLLENGDISDQAGEYGERGYSFRHDATTPMIILANYNQDIWKKHGRIQAQMEAQGVEFEWLDEWHVLNDKAYRMSPDGAFWQPSWVWHQGEPWGWDEIVACGEVADYIGSLVNDPRKTVHVADFNTDALVMGGWFKHNGDFNNGYHQGMDDDPVKITDYLHAIRPGVDILFVVPEVSMFYITFQAWLRYPAIPEDCTGYWAIWPMDLELGTDCYYMEHDDTCPVHGKEGEGQ